MTYREWMQKHYPNLVVEKFRGGVIGCPKQYNTDFNDWCEHAGQILDENDEENDCQKCWDTEMPGIKDSGERTEFSTGAVRDMHDGKGDMVSMPWAALLRVSKHYETGAKKYGRFNYQKGIPVSSFIDSACRHLAKYQCGYDDEDHLAAAAFNVLGAIQMEETQREMIDLEARKGKRAFPYEPSKGGADE